MTPAPKVGADGASAVPEGIYDMSDPSLFSEMAEEAEAKLEAMLRQQLSETAPAKYKLELLFSKRHRDQPYYGLVTYFKNGGFAQGGGDEAIYLCSRPLGEGKYCTGIVEIGMIVNKRAALCPKCKQTSHPKNLAGQVGYKLTTQGWVKVLLRAYHVLEAHADITMWHYPHDVISAAMEAQEKQVGGDKVLALRAERRLVIYTRARILEDLAAGSSLESRFRAFLMA